MNEIVKVFEDRPVRIIEENGNPLFVGRDVCALLGYKNPNKAMNDHCKGITKRYPLSTDGGVQEVRVISEPDVMRLICGSKLPAAVRFEKWVFEEVLPSIRKTGAYVAPNIGLEQLAAVAKKIGEMAKRLIVENAELREKIEYMEQFIPDDDEFGKPSKINGKAKWRKRRGCYVSVNGSKPKRLNPDTNGYLQLDLFRDFIPAMLIADAVNIINIHCPKLLEGTANV